MNHPPPEDAPFGYVPISELKWLRDVGLWRRDTAGHRLHFDLPHTLEPHLPSLDGWENEVFDSMSQHLEHGDVFYDVGAEQGWMSLVYASFVGAENMVLVEPCHAVWPNIRATWERNYPGRPPLACYHGFMSDKTQGAYFRSAADFWPWPARSIGDIAGFTAYSHINEHAHEVPQMKLDDLVGALGDAPNVINIDVEGAEAKVLLGAQQTLLTHHPVVYVAIHPEFMSKRYGHEPAHVHTLMEECGYTNSALLSTHHEENWVFHV